MSDAAGRRAWLSVSALLAALAMIGWSLVGPTLAATALDWQPGRIWPEWWRAFSPVAVHYSGMHLTVNLAGLAAVAALGWAAQVPMRSALTWIAAWPLTHLALGWQPALAHYGGLSGALHGGVVIVGLHLAWAARGPRWVIGVLVLLAVAAKVMAEAPWGPPLRHPPGWDIAVAPLAHATGALAGLVCSIAAEVWHARRAAPPSSAAGD